MSQEAEANVPITTPPYQSIAQRRAMEFRWRHRLTLPPGRCQVRRLAAFEGCEVEEWPLSPPLMEFTIDGAIVIAKRLSVQWKRWCVLHALGHHLLHAGNQLELASGYDPRLYRQERQADAFAGWVLWAGLHDPHTWDAVELAELGLVPVECADRWLSCLTPVVESTSP